MASLLGQTTAEADARLVQATGEPINAGFKLTRNWPWLAVTAGAGETLGSLLTTAKAVASYTNPQADGYPYSGTFVNSKTYALDETPQGEGDRSGTIVQELTKVTSVASLVGLAALTPVVVQGDEVRETFTTATGQADFIMLKYKYLLTSSRAFCMGEAASNLVTLVSTGDYQTWVAGAAYVVGSRVLNVSTRYICITNHTAGATFAGDAAKWTTLDAWTYADRKWTDEDDNTGTFVVLLQREKWQTGTAESDAIVLGIDAGLGSREASVTLGWLRRTKTARDTLCTVTSGEARKDHTIESTTYSYSSHDSQEIGQGGWNVIERVAIPRNGVRVHDMTGEVLWEAHEELVLFSSSSSSFSRVLVQDYAKIFSSSSAAGGYCDGGTEFYDIQTGMAKRRSYLRYLRANTWEAHCVMMTVLTGATPAWSFSTPP